MTYTVKAGDSLSKILKNLGVSSYASPSTWSLIQTRSGSPHLIRVGEQLNLSPVAHMMPGYQAPAPVTISTASKSQEPVTTSTASKSQELSREAAKYVPTREAFWKKYGTEEELIPTAAIQQFAAQQVNPEALRQSVRTMADVDLRRAISGSGAQVSGYGAAERENVLAALERQRKTDMDQYINQQKNLFTDWYSAEMQSYMNSQDPNWTWNTAGLSGTLGGTGYTPTKKAGGAVYNPLDLRDYFRGGVSGYQQAPGNLYGTIT